MLNYREQKILKILYDSQSYITVKKLSKQIDFSPQTVRNDLKKIKNYIDLNNLGEIILKPGRGIAFITTKENWEKLQSLQNDEMTIDASTAKRKLMVCKIMLTSNITNMANLTKKLYLSKSGVKKALSEAETWLLGRNIRLKKVRGKGYQIVCTELSRRIALLELFSDMQKCNKQLAESLGKLEAKSNLANEIFSFFDGFNPMGAIDTIQKTENNFGMCFNYVSKGQLAFCLSLSVYECKLNNAIGKVSIWGASPFNREVAKDITKRLQSVYNITIPEGETEYITLCVSISEINNFTDISSLDRCKKNEESLCKIIDKLINLISNIIGINFKYDKTLFMNLFLYLRSAIECCRYQIHHKANPICLKIKNDYQNIYTVALTASILFEDEMQIEIGDNEIGMLTLYIIEAIYRANSNVKICILCNYGIGISQFLKQKIERFIPNISVSILATSQDTEKIISNDCDFIVTTQNIGTSCKGKDVVVVDNLLLPYDIKCIEKEIARIRRQKLNKIAVKEKNFKVKLFVGKCVYFVDNSGQLEKKALLKDMCMQLEKSGYVLKGFLNSVLKRENRSSTNIGKHVAIPHGSTKFVIRPIISVALLKKPIIWNENEWVDLVFLLALKQDDTFSTKSQMMKFYSVLTTLIDDENCLKYTKAKEICDRDGFADYMNKLTNGDDGLY
jgi:transcriptional antiterminator/mannitol/fructose-specific phosphotransferase system IIA component (Ntr-type)